MRRSAQPSTPIDTHPTPSGPTRGVGTPAPGYRHPVTTDHIPTSTQPRRSFDVPRVVAWAAVVGLSVALWIVAAVAVVALI